MLNRECLHSTARYQRYPLRDGFHLGQRIINDYSRPYQEGFNNYTGFSAHTEADRFALYFRGEYQHAPSAAGYSFDLFSYLSNLDIRIPVASNATIPLDPIAGTNRFRVQEASLSPNPLNHQSHSEGMITGGGLNQGSSFAWSDNAENIYAFQSIALSRYASRCFPGS